MISIWSIAIISGILLSLGYWRVTFTNSFQKCELYFTTCACFLGGFAIGCGIKAFMGKDYYEPVILNYCNDEIKTDTAAVTPEDTLYEIKITKEK